MKSKTPLLIIASFFSIYVIWGSTYLLNKIAVMQLPPFQVGAIRFLVAGILIFIIAKFSGYSLKITRKQLMNTCIAGFLFLAGGNGILVWALKYVDSGLAALEISAQPLVVIILLRLIDGKKIKAMSVIGVILGIIGIYLLISQKQLISSEDTVVGLIMIFFCMLSWAFGSIFVSKADLPSNFFINTGYQMISGGIFILIGSFAVGEQWIGFSSWKQEVQLSMLILVVFGSIVAFTSFNYLLRVVSPEKVATSTYVNPLIALLLGWYFLEESITTQSIVAAGVLLTGVYFINTKKMLTIFNRFKKEA
ncbi:drug/metabolite transporter (DMT)-like permease [Oceanihabitans sediminis]|uniref:EamA family transporter n=1 Tax=Oceanihabitans sediminis TaxID=1812012 RepID=A0A368P519_9FLAO|nr:EamA family transporter [Oceanihabitans sediminis]MDX1773666.1 EamA family transporter [Oceanihabitans sediminis]RBP33110.1 drug/metabolite transporter (DMT)-like permease [Oceanihabitans sediminis]RCU57380.1 EamA family transporter [Oceanihabitans sediminis]